MACPKCGGQSTEYDDKKWSCLKCGNKFVYEPTQTSHTLIQSNVHIQGQATFELDVENAKSPLPKMVRMIEHDPNYFGNQIEDKKRAITASKALKYPIYILKYFFLIICVIAGLAEVLGGISLLLHKSNSDDDVIGLFGGICLFAFAFMLFWKFRSSVKRHDVVIQHCQQTIYSLEYQNQTDTKIGDYIICPHCENHFEYVALNSMPPAESLKHCLNCGRQFFTSGLNSYPVKFK